MKSGILEEKCRFFPKRFLVKFLKHKGLKLTEEHILTLLNKKSKNQARSSKNDLHEFEGKIRKFAQNSRNFRILGLHVSRIKLSRTESQANVEVDQLSKIRIQNYSGNYQAKM